jgi:hypothetical protein
VTVFEGRFEGNSDHNHIDELVSMACPFIIKYVHNTLSHFFNDEKLLAT